MSYHYFDNNHQLVYVIFSTAVNPKSASKFAPMAIGLTVLVDHLVGVPFTGIVTKYYNNWYYYYDCLKNWCCY